MNKPFFTIIIPCYNQAHFLPECLDSLLQQDYEHWEALVINDGSPDDTNEIAGLYLTKDSRIKLFQKANGGLSSARNYGIAHANGERFIFLDADDFLYPNCLGRIAAVSGESTPNDLIQYGYTYVKEDGKSILGTTYAKKTLTIIPDIFKNNLGPCHSVCISKELTKASGFFDETLKSVEDWDFWARAVKSGGQQKLIHEPLVFYRYSKNSMSRNPFVMYEALKTVIERGPQEDNRIMIDSPLNINYEFDTQLVLNDVLVRSVGVGVMQGKIDEMLDFFNRVSVKPLMDYRPQEFEIMCSYMSFRYWYSRSDVAEVFFTIYPNFKEFLVKAGYNSSFRKKALYGIFKRHLFYRNRYRYGNRFGSLINSFLRIYNR